MKRTFNEDKRTIPPAYDACQGAAKVREAKAGEVIAYVAKTIRRRVEQGFDGALISVGPHKKICATVIELLEAQGYKIVRTGMDGPSGDYVVTVDWKHGGIGL